jgi:GTP pyrophosphokinase
MHGTAEYGIAAHWKYKQGGAGGGSEKDLEWVRRLLESQQDSDAEEYVQSLKIDMFDDEVFVFTPKGRIVSLPAGSTPIDFAYAIHSGVGNSMIGAKVNNRISNIDASLKNGDIVEILTSKSQRVQPAWINFANTAKAKSKINAILKREQRSMLQAGEDKLQEFLNKENLEWSDDNIHKLCVLHNMKNPDELCTAIGFKTIILGEEDINELKKDKTPANSWKKIFNFGGKSSKEKTEEISKKEPAQKIDSKKILRLTPEGIQKNYLIADCCKPIPGDDALGFIDDKNQIIIHKRQCKVAAKLKTSFGNRLLAVQWETGKALDFPVNIYIQGIDAIGILHKVADIVTEQLNVNIRKIFIETVDGIFEGHIQLYVHDVEDVKVIIKNLNKIEEMKVVTRVEKFEDKP